VHRLIILGERTTSYALVPSDLRFRHFFWWWAALSAATFFPLFLLEMMPLTRAMAPLPFLIVMVPILIVLIGIIIGTLRLTLIFPAVAVDAPGARWENVMADTKGHAARIFLLGLLATLPLILPAFILSALVATGIATGSWIFRLLDFVLGAVLVVAAMTLFIVIASRLFLWLGNRVKTG
jgi:hypothetical protein